MSEEILSEDEETNVLERIVRNQLKIKELQEENDLLKTYYRQSPDGFPAGTRRQVGKFYVQVSSNTRLDDGLAKKELADNLYANVSKTVLDTTKAKRVLTEETLAKITKVFDNKIEVGLV